MQEPHFIEGSLKMNENIIQESLRILHDTKALVSNSCYVAHQVLEHGIQETSNKGEYSREPEFINELGQVHPISKET